MKCNVTFRHMTASDSLRNFAEDKIDKVTKLLEKGGEAQVTVSLEKHVHVAHIELVLDGSLAIRGIGKSEDMYQSIELAVEKIVRQVKRYRSKIRDHHRSESRAGRELPHKILRVEEQAHQDEVELPKIVKQETLTAREMTIEDAVMQMDLLDSDFMVFTHPINHQLHVIYRMPDGHYGLIEARN